MPFRLFCQNKMKQIWILMLVSIFATNSLDKAESVKLELKTFDEIFGEGWDKDEAEDLKTQPPTNFGQNVHHQIDRQNTQLGQIESNSTDQNPPLTESDHSDKAKNGGELNEITSNAEEERTRKIVDKFHAMKKEFKQKGKFSAKEWNQIDNKIAKHLKVNRKKIYKWKKELGKTGPKYSDDEKLKIVKMLMQMKSERSGEDKKSCKEMDKEIAERFGVNVGTINQWKKKFGLSQKVFTEKERKHLIEKFDKMKTELKRDGFKSSHKHKIDETVAKELGLCFATIYNWKSELGQTAPNQKYSQSKQKELMKRYYEIKDQNPKISDENIAKMLKIGRATLYKWKKQFDRQQFHPNSVDGHSVEENAAANLQEIRNSNSGSTI